MKPMLVGIPNLLKLVPFVALAAIPFVADDFTLQLLTRCLIMAVFAMSLDLIVGSTGLVSFGHAAFFGIGAYTLMLLSPGYEAANFWASLPIALIVAGFAALIIGLLVLRSSGVYFIMATLAFAQMLFYFVTRSKALGGSDGAFVNVRPEVNVFGWQLVNLDQKIDFFYLTLLIAIVVYIFLAVMLRSLFGQVLIGIKENEYRLSSLGFATFKYKLAAFVISGALASLAGYLDAVQFGIVTPELFGWHLSGTVLMMIILGGMGTLYGPVLGAFAFVLLQNYLSDMTKHWLLPMGLFIMLVALFLPRGLAGSLRLLPMMRKRLEAGDV